MSVPHMSGQLGSQSQPQDRALSAQYRPTFNHLQIDAFLPSNRDFSPEQEGLNHKRRH